MIEVVIVEQKRVGAKQAYAEARRTVIEQLKDGPLCSKCPQRASGVCHDTEPFEELF